MSKQVRKLQRKIRDATTLDELVEVIDSSKFIGPYIFEKCSEEKLQGLLMEAALERNNYVIELILNFSPIRGPLSIDLWDDFFIEQSYSLTNATYALDLIKKMIKAEIIGEELGKTIKQNAILLGDSHFLNKLFEGVEGLQLPPNSSDLKFACKYAKPGNDAMLHIIQRILTYPGVRVTPRANNALRYAIKNENSDVVSELLKPPRVRGFSRAGETICDVQTSDLKYAIKHGNPNIFRMVLKEITIDSDEVIDLIEYIVDKCEDNQPELLAELLKNLPEGERLSHNKTILPYIIRHTAPPRSSKMVETVLEHAGVDPALGDNRALILATRNKDIESIKLLLNDSRVDPTSNLKLLHEVNDLDVAHTLFSDARLNENDALKLYTIHHIAKSPFNKNNADVMHMLIKSLSKDARPKEDLIEVALHAHNNGYLKMFLEDDRFVTASCLCKSGGYFDLAAEFKNEYAVNAFIDKASEMGIKGIRWSKQNSEFVWSVIKNRMEAYNNVYRVLESMSDTMGVNMFEVMGEDLAEQRGLSKQDQKQLSRTYPWSLLEEDLDTGEEKPSYEEYTSSTKPYYYKAGFRRMKREQGEKIQQEKSPETQKDEKKSKNKTQKKIRR